jgi:FAD/FMN-containing dehydrogenase
MKIAHPEPEFFEFALGAAEVNIAEPNEGERAMSVPSVADAAAELAGAFSGQLLKPADAGYEEARKVHNGLVDKRPALIARCRGVADVVDAISLTRKLGLEVAVRGGGHNVAGRATIDGGLMIDLAPMKGIHVDPKSRTARAQGGVTWAELNRETQLHGLAVTGGVVSSTGVAGLTLGGGLGWLMGKYGLALDNLRSVELVTAEGKVLRASKDEAPDLFWAVRGGGGNFGVVTSFEFQLHPVGPTVTGGLIAHPFDRARDLLKFFRDSTASLPDEHMIFGGLIHAPDGSGTKLAVMVTCHCGSLADGEKAMRPLKEFQSPVVDTLGSMPYCQLNGMLDAAYPKGALNYWKSSFLSQLSDEAIDTMIDSFAQCPTPMGQLLLEHFHGAATRVGVTDTAFPHRAEGYNFLVLGEWMERADNDRCIAWARETYSRMKPFMASGRYVNYLADDETGELVAAAYGPNYRRLQQLKAKYDPKNFFRMNQNIRPLV